MYMLCRWLGCVGGGHFGSVMWGREYTTWGGIKSPVRMFWAPFASSWDYLLLGLGRMLYYGSQAAVSVLLLMFRDCLGYDEDGARYDVPRLSRLRRG